MAPTCGRSGAKRTSFENPLLARFENFVRLPQSSRFGTSLDPETTNVVEVLVRLPQAEVRLPQASPSVGRLPQSLEARSFGALAAKSFKNREVEGGIIQKIGVEKELLSKSRIDESTILKLLIDRQGGWLGLERKMMTTLIMMMTMMIVSPYHHHYWLSSQSSESSSPRWPWRHFGSSLRMLGLCCC